MSSPSLALVGCGAIADFFHLPALQRRPDLVKSLILVDRDLERAEAVRAKLGAAKAVVDHREILGQVQGAIVATPHRLHRAISLDFINSKAHVLSEKPLTESASEVDEIVRAAKDNGVHVAVNHTRRLFSSTREIARLVASGELGDLQRIDYELGEPFMWPAATDTYFGVKSGGRGVLFDTGAHILDLVCWWMGGQPRVIDYRDDSRGGTEAVARVELERNGARARVHLSWLSKLRNVYRVECSRGTIEGGVYEWSSFQRTDPGGRPRKVKTDKARSFDDFSDMLLANFVSVIEGRAEPIVSASDARAAIAVMDECYARRSTFSEPWHDAYTRLAHV
jgi:predicted dehydrogenase